MTQWPEDQARDDRGRPGESPLSSTTEQRQSRLPAILGVVAITAIVGAVIIIALLNRETQGAQPVPTTSSPAPLPPTTASTQATSQSSPSSTVAPTDRRVVENRAARLSYPVPNDWKEQPEEVKVLNVAFTGTTTYGDYRCGDKDRTRTWAASAAVQNTDKRELDPRETAETFAKAFADERYPGAKADAPTARTSEIDGRKAVMVITRVRQGATDCLPGAAMVAVLAVDLDNATATTARGVALLVITSDLEGGPATPEPLPENTVQAVMAGTRVE